MKIWSDAFSHGSPIPSEYAFGKHDPVSRLALSSNRSPPLSWSEVPASARSLVLVCHDPDVPSRSDDVNQEGRRVPSTLLRAEFFHWILMDIPVTTTSLPAGFGSDGITPRGKSGPAAAAGMRHGVNDYTAWFANDAQMSGTYFGYDGPCPPWNDTIVHHYWFTLYALDVERCPAAGEVRGADVRKALEAHTVAQASVMGTYTVAPDATDLAEPR